MKKWGYKSLEWIHQIREKDYNETKNLSPKELIEKTRNAVEDAAKGLGLKVVQAKTPSTH